MTRRALLVLTAAWVVVAVLGFHALMRYKGETGPQGQTPPTWPGSTALSLPKDKPLLIMFAHPKCPCTQASLAELEVLAARAEGRFDAAVLFYQPHGFGGDWTNTSSIKTARAIPGVRVLSDEEGAAARAFGAETSGHTVLYGRDGKLQFAGGITGSRGHLGDNAGLETVLKLILNDRSGADQRAASVFGCALFEQCTRKQTAN